MPFYESTFIARQDISANQVDSLAESFSAVISNNGGTVGRQEYWGLRTLAYRIKKNRKGHYVMFKIDAPAAAVAEMERSMRLSEDVLRYLTVRVDRLDSEPSVIMQARANREGSRRAGSKGKSEARDADPDKTGGNSSAKGEEAEAKAAPDTDADTANGDSAKEGGEATAASEEKGE